MSDKSLDSDKLPFAGSTHHKSPKPKDLPRPKFEKKNENEIKEFDLKRKKDKSDDKER